MPKVIAIDGGNGGRNGGFKQWFWGWIKTTPAIVISVSAALAVLWGVFVYAVQATPTGAQVAKLTQRQDDQEQRIDQVSTRVEKNADADSKRHRETMVELWTVQVLAMIDRNVGNRNAKEQILLLCEKIKGAGGWSEYLDYEKARYINSISQ